MGSFFDEKDFNDFGQSDKRFKNALTNLFKNKWYNNNSDWVFKNFRGPLIHQYRPGDAILLTSYCKNGADSALVGLPSFIFNKLTPREPPFGVLTNGRSLNRFMLTLLIFTLRTLVRRRNVGLPG